MNTPTDRPDFMFHFQRHAEKEKLSTAVIEAQATVVILAGSETTAVALTAVAYHVLSNPEVYTRLCNEIRGTFSAAAGISLQDVLSKLPYLDAVVKEALRIHTPLANGFTRVVTESSGAIISGNRIPKNVSLFSSFVLLEFVSPYVGRMLNRQWPDRCDNKSLLRQHVDPELP